MNSKAKIATIVAIIMVVFLIGITAVRFNWAGMFSQNNKETPESSEKEEPTKKEDEGITTVTDLKCSLKKDSTDLKVNDTYMFHFLEGRLFVSENTVTVSYTKDATKTSFDQYIKKYQDTVIGHNGLTTIRVSEELKDKSYAFTENISYVDDTLASANPTIPFNTNMDSVVIQEMLEQQGYTCSAN